PARPWESRGTGVRDRAVRSGPGDHAPLSPSLVLLGCSIGPGPTFGPKPRFRSPQGSGQEPRPIREATTAPRRRQHMRAIALNAEGQFALVDVEPPAPQRGEVLVRVQAVSLNPRDLRSAGGKPGFRPGIDFAGVVEQAPSPRSPLQPGVRVAGLIPQGS